MDSPDENVRTGVARDIVFLEAVEINPVVVHGGGKAITRAMEKAGLKADFIQGQRVTDEATVKIVDDVLSREINPEVVKTINALGGQAVGFAGPDIFKCRKLLLDDRENPGQKIDIGYVGEVVGLHRAIEGKHLVRFHAGHQPDGARRGRQDLQLQRRRGGGATRHCAQGQAARVHERRAGFVARSRSSPIPSFRTSRPATWMRSRKSGVIDKGMIPKVDSAVAAIKVRRGKGVVRGRPGAACRDAGNLHRRRRRDGNRFVRDRAGEPAHLGAMKD